ncbi:ClbS/DfsB family four-helix bundle protein [Rhizobium sp. RU36D]|uniref:ClbS/DfsB family four-helix bundle protein n=1 Tax=Rhizobium sp. RU36D TaxID=1907415 RepID=UPI0009D7BD49|nr:ClbS/DfsB family four-helix bundle protein [Rhizobium sp. RU36D]SMD19897.1 hypothetical protein SAMN05880593_1453 [Rhizobium sp. RU36D]
MAVPQNKAALLAAINSNFDKLLAELRAVPEDEAATADMEGHAKGTRMSVCDLTAYLIGWNELVLKWLDRDAKGQPIDFPDTGFQWNELGKLAQRFYRDYKGVLYPDLLDRLQAAKARTVSLIEARNDAELYGQAWYGKWTIGRMIQFNTASPYANARTRLRKHAKVHAGKR